MPEGVNGAEWVGVHAFDHAARVAVVARVVSPLLREWRAAGRIRHGFYLYHWEGGPHVRVRALPRAPHERAALEGELVAALGACLSATPTPTMSDDAYRALRAQRSRLEAAGDDALYPSGTAHVIAYRPEWDRFGGAHLAASTSRVFDVSSVCAAEAHEHGWDRSRRIASALRTATATLRRVAPDAAWHAEAARRTADFWARSLGPGRGPFEAAVRSNVNRNLPALRAWWSPEACADDAHARTLSDTIGAHVRTSSPPDGSPWPSLAMATDLLHLHHNRLGLSLGEEVQVWLTLACGAPGPTKGGADAP